MKKDVYLLESEGKKLELTNLDKIFWPKEKYTKGDLLLYYQQIAPYILPYLINRPTVLHRFPNGILDKGFFQKDAKKLEPPKWIKLFNVQHEEKVVPYIIIENEMSLYYAINLGAFELHPFLSETTSLDYPNNFVIDLDPKDLSFEHVIETALVLHEILNELKIPSFCKTSGKKGLHIHIPLNQKYHYKEAKEIAEWIAKQVNKELPQTTTLKRSATTKKKIFLDFLRNTRGQTVVSPYSVRPVPLATVSTPLEWNEVKKGLDPQKFTIKTVMKRLEKKGDLFKQTLGKESSSIRKIVEVIKGT